ncbi:hypothetical protein Mal4_05180 [Maioricimonas rarisocia]|uniref:HTH cro/C1-type domain-containing protein n=1 Tax=Maioricimonas rarisocia TaxID=2528026 RepID=A0A517Z190_9PLAN|nr:helix-turn-helix transcriptional regulator [Maioricimonas rarisocia]QDU36234.1 hypothetical protein Mal4_05180 [Maioricimonas rarisocia]
MATKPEDRSRQTARRRVHVIATNAAYEKLCRTSLNRLPPQHRKQIHLQTVSSQKQTSSQRAQACQTLYVSRLADLPQKGARGEHKVESNAKHLLFVSGPIEAMAARLPRLGIRSPHRLHLAAEREEENVAGLIYRLFSGMTHADGSQPIVDAWVEQDNLVLLSPAFDRMVVPLEKLSPLIGTDSKKIAAFDIDEDGVFLYWPHADVHLGREQFRQIVDPVAAVAAQQKSQEFNRRYGAAIRELREESGLRQSDVPGITARHLRRVEHGGSPATSGVLRALADAHGRSLDDYLKQLATRLRQQAPENARHRSKRRNRS